MNNGQTLGLYLLTFVVLFFLTRNHIVVDLVAALLITAGIKLLVGS